MIITGTKMSMVRGDSESITVRCSAGFSAGDKITFTVREDVESPIALQKEVTEFPTGDAVISIDPSDTSGLDFGDYVYDIQWTTAGGAVTTIVEKSRFTLREEVTY